MLQKVHTSYFSAPVLPSIKIKACVFKIRQGGPGAWFVSDFYCNKYTKYDMDISKLELSDVKGDRQN